MKTQEKWRIGDAGKTIFGPKTDAPAPESIATVWKKKHAPILRAAPELLATVRALLDCAELNQDDLEPETRALLKEASALIEPLKTEE